MKARVEWMLLVMLLFAIVVPGCGSNGVPTKRIRGMVTFKGSAPPKAGGIVFTPIERTGDFPIREARGIMDASGAFTLTTYKDGDGVVPGKYRVKITCWRETPTPATSATANFVPPSFGPEVVISPDDKDPVSIAIDVPTIQGK